MFYFKIEFSIFKNYLDISKLFVTFAVDFEIVSFGNKKADHKKWLF